MGNAPADGDRREYSSRMMDLAKSRAPSPRGGVGGSVPVLSHPRRPPPVPVWLTVGRAEAHPRPSQPFEEPKAPTPAPLKSGRETGKDNETRPEKTERASEALAAFWAFLEFNH